MSDRIALLRSGELEQVASPREIYSRPATAYAAQFIGHTNLLKAEVQGGVARCGTLSWRTQLPDGQALFSLRPENIRVSTGATSDGAVRLDARVTQHAFHGDVRDCGFVKGRGFSRATEAHRSVGFSP